MKVVVDSSVVVSAFLTRKGVAAEFLRLGADGQFLAYLSNPIPSEVHRSLERPRLMRRYGHDAYDVAGFISDLALGVRLIADLPAIDPVCRDPNDDHVLAAALAVHADWIVTGDHDLLDLGEWRGIRILSVRSAIEALAARGSP